MASTQECVGGTHNPEVLGRYQIIVLPRDTGLSCLKVVTWAIQKSDRLYNHRHVY